MLTKTAIPAWVKHWPALSQAARNRIATAKGLVFDEAEAIRRINNASDSMLKRTGADFVDVAVKGTPRYLTDIARKNNGGAMFFNPATKRITVAIDGSLSPSEKAMAKYHEALETLNTTAGNSPRDVAFRRQAEAKLNKLSPLRRLLFDLSEMRRQFQILGRPVSRAMARQAVLEESGRAIARGRITKDTFYPRVLSEGAVIDPAGNIIENHTSPNVLLREAQLINNPKFYNVRDRFYNTKKLREDSGEEGILARALGRKHTYDGNPILSRHLRVVRKNIYNSAKKGIPVMQRFM